jgi:protein-tyrosine phosphatase
MEGQYIINPKTGRQIKIGGPTYEKMMLTKSSPKKSSPKKSSPKKSSPKKSSPKKPPRKICRKDESCPCENANFILQDQGHSLWLGNIESPQDKSFIQTNNIKVVFNITRKQYPTFPDVKYYQIPISDSDTPAEMKKFYGLADSTSSLIHQELKENNVLIHCEMGMQRSAAIVASYIIKYSKLTPEEAIAFIKSKREVAFKTRVTFLEALYKLYK